MPAFERALRKAEILKKCQTVKVALVQDEFFRMDVVCSFINEFDIRHVFSVSPPSEWPKIYKTIDFRKVNLYQVLTGYLEDGTVARINKLAGNASNRTIDIGYRAWKAEPWLGRHGFLKTQLADLFMNKASEKGLSTDISTRYEDTFLGDDWYKFLLRCKYTIGVEGGASLLDWDGKIRQKTQAYIEHRPQAPFEEVEAACFPGLDGSLSLFAISPRHLEASATKTCQVLVEGEYNGLLDAGTNYIEVKRDFSNIEQVLALMKEEGLRDEMVERTYRDVVESGRCSYTRLVDLILECTANTAMQKEAPLANVLVQWLLWRWTKLRDALSWQMLRIYWKIKPFLK